PEGGPAATDGVEQCGFTADVQVRFHLPGEGGPGQVLGGGGGAHGDRRRAQDGVGPLDHPGDFRRDGGVGEQGGNVSGDRRESRHVPGGGGLREPLNLPLQVAGGNELTIRGGGDDEP